MMGAVLGNQTSRTSQVDQELNRLDAEVGRLEGLAATLREGLSVVLRSEPPSPTKNEKAVEEVLVSRADAIRNQRVRIMTVASEIESLVSRLEV